MTNDVIRLSDFYKMLFSIDNGSDDGGQAAKPNEEEICFVK